MGYSTFIIYLFYVGCNLMRNNSELHALAHKNDGQFWDNFKK